MATNIRGKCKSCRREFKVDYRYELKKRKFCSYSCYHSTLKDKWIGKKNPRYTENREKICLQCKKKFCSLRNPKKKFCNIICKGRYYSGNRNPKYTGGKRKKVCSICFKTYLRTNKESVKSKFCSYRCYHASMPITHKGENSSNWQGGKDSRKNEIRKSIYYRKWQEKVRKRDKNCKLCSSRKKLETHHITPIRDNPNLIFKVGNGILLCHNCHAKTFWQEYKFTSIFNKILNDYTSNTVKVKI